MGVTTTDCAGVPMMRVPVPVAAIARLLERAIRPYRCVCAIRPATTTRHRPRRWRMSLLPTTIHVYHHFDDARLVPAISSAVITALGPLLAQQGNSLMAT